MNNHPDVSIVLPTFNRADMLSGSIESCLNQRHENFELIIIDDGSTDNTREVVNEFIKKDNRVKYFKKKNEGLPKALNYGFDRASGKFFSWTSDDNYFREDALKIMLDELTSDEKYKLVYCDYNLIDDNENNLGKVFRKDSSYIVKEPTVGACFLYSSECAKIIGQYDPKWRLVEDAEFFVRFAKSFPCKHVSGVHPYFYRIHEDSLGWSEYENVQKVRYKMFAFHSENMFTRFELYYKYNYDCGVWAYNKGRTNGFIYIIICIIMKPYKINLWLFLVKIILPNSVKSFWKKYNHKYKKVD